MVKEVPLGPLLEASLPVVSVTKSSLSKVAPAPPPPAALMASARVAVPVPDALVAESVMVELPVVVGVPETRPLAVLTLSPAGRPLAPKEVGLLVAAI